LVVLNRRNHSNRLFSRFAAEDLISIVLVIVSALTMSKHFTRMLILPTFTDLGLDPKILRLLEEIGFETPTPIQEQAIPALLEGRDVLASAQTGTGKTAAFMLPALHKLCDPDFRGENGPQVVVLVPTRELAMQVADEAKKFSKYLSKVKTVCIYGGAPYPVQKRALSGKFEILVATPGRLIDHMNAGRIQFSAVKMFVLDEADRMLDMGFLEAVEEISSAIPSNRQTLLFSATIDRKILPVSRQLQKDPVEIRIQPSLERQSAIEQTLYYVDNIAHKIQILDHILANTEINQSIVFTSTIRQAGELAEQLQEKGYRSEALHGDMNQRQRTKTIERLRAGKIQFLIATDVAARGIDVATISHVVNFDLPFVAEDFIHRIGRTGRAGATGTAITFASAKERPRLSDISKLLGKEITPAVIPGLEPTIKERVGFSPKGRRDRRRMPERSFQERSGNRPERSFQERSNDRAKRSEGNEFWIPSDKPKAFGTGAMKPFKKEKFAKSGPGKSFGKKPFSKDKRF